MRRIKEMREDLRGVLASVKRDVKTMKPTEQALTALHIHFLVGTLDVCERLDRLIELEERRAPQGAVASGLGTMDWGSFLNDPEVARSSPSPAGEPKKDVLAAVHEFSFGGNLYRAVNRRFQGLGPTLQIWRNDRREWEDRVGRTSIAAYEILRLAWLVPSVRPQDG